MAGSFLCECCDIGRRNHGWCMEAHTPCQIVIKRLLYKIVLCSKFAAKHFIMRGMATEWNLYAEAHCKCR